MELGGEEFNVLEMLSFLTLNIQQNFFKTTMKNQAIVAMQLPLDLNPLTWLWTQHQALEYCDNLLEYLKLSNISSNVLFLGYVEDERRFSTLKFYKFNFCNRLGVHLPMVVRMFWQKTFPLVNFPYKEAIESWKSENKWYDDSQIMILLLLYPLKLDQILKVS